MSHGRIPRLFSAVCPAIFLLAATVLVAGCKQKGEAAGGAAGGGRRIALGGADAVEEALGDAEGGQPQAATQAEEGASAAAPAGPVARGGRGRASGTQVAQAGRGAGGARGGRGGRRGAGGAAGPQAGPGAGATSAAAPSAPAEAAAEAGTGEEAGTEVATTGIPEVDKMAVVREFAALYGPTTLIKSRDWDGTEFEWVSVTSDEGKVKGRQIVMPVNMVTNAKYLEWLEGYFPIYVRGARPLGEIVSRETITEPRKRKRTTKEIRELEGAAARARAAAQAAADAAAPAAGAGGGPGMGGPGGGRGGFGGMRGGRGGGRF